MGSLPLPPALCRLVFKVMPQYLLIVQGKNLIYANQATKRLLKKKSLSAFLTNIPENGQQVLPGRCTPIVIRWRRYHYLSATQAQRLLLIGEDRTEHESLVRQLRLLNKILTQVPGFVFWKDKRLTLQGCNQNFSRQVGLKCPQDIVGLTDHDLPWSHEQTEQFLRDDRAVLKTGTPRLNVEERQRQLNGQDMHLLTSKTPLYDHGEIVGLLGIYVDITPLKQAEEALRLQKEKAESADQLKTQFMLNMQHDIRTPLSGILGMTELLAEQTKSPDARTYLIEVAQAAKALLTHCQNIVDFSRQEYGPTPVLNKPFHLKAVIAAVLRLQKPGARLKKIRLFSCYGRSVPDIVLGDKDRLHRILLNLVSNAVKFTDQGHVKCAVRVSHKSPTSRDIVLQISIQDTGIGIPPEQLTYLYEKFNRLTPSNKGLYTGSGLGLSLVKQLVAELDGDMTVNSVVQQGTRFTVFIPLRLPLSPQILQEE